ncbi:ABC transporter substrate-binding protein [Bacillus carboniphilus]|uniref:ABC transporter substrate-binding protein n=1 Tax=Bacillus carboniphilus TaxID=86663 RepID=A0ABP3G101_9BACI
MKKNLQAGLLLLVSLFFILSGCGKDSSNQAQTNTDTPKKDTLTIGLDAEPPSLDPHRSSSSVDRQVLQGVYSKLLEVNEDLEIVPSLVKEWDISDDGKTYTFSLREDVTFHDGTDFNAEAVKFNFERMLDPDFGSPRKSELELIDQVNVVNETTLEVVLTEPYAPFLSVLTDRAGMMISPTAIQELGEDIANKPVGAGPYKFVERVAQSHITLTRNDDYWGEAPKIKEVVYKTITDENIRVTNMTSGDLDIVTTIGFKDIAQLEKNAGITVSRVDGLGFQGMHLNMSREPFNNKNIREAINIGIDRQALASVVFHGGAVPSVSPFPPSSWANNSDIAIPEGDIEKAKQLVKESGIENPSFTIKIAPSETEKQTAQMLQSMLKEIGITMDIEMVERGKLIEDEFSGNFDVTRLGWSGRTDPDGNAYNYFVSDGVYNFTGINNDEMDRLLNEARTSVDQKVRAENYQTFSEILFEEAPYIFLYHEQDVKVMKKNVKGFTHVPDGIVRPETLYFE